MIGVAFQRRHGFTCTQGSSQGLGFGFGFCLCRSSIFCPLPSWAQRAGSGSFSQDAGASSPACPPEQLCVTSPAVLAVTQLIGFCAVPVFTKCFYVKYEKDGNVQSGEKYTSVQCFSWNIYCLLPNSHQSQQLADRLFWPFSKSPSKQPQVLLALCVTKLLII